MAERRRKRRRGHDIEEGFAIAGVITPEVLQGVMESGQAKDAADVFFSEDATIQAGAHVVRTKKGTMSHGRTRDNHFVYVPFWKARGEQDPCIMAVKQLVLIRKTGMGWPNDEARLVVGTMYDNLAVRSGVGLEDSYNDDYAKKATCVPRVIYASDARIRAGYPWAVYLSQVHCPVCHFSQSKKRKGMSFITVSKMGYHGRQDALYEE